MVAIAQGIVFSVSCKIILNFKCALLKWGFIRNSNQWLAYLCYRVDRTGGAGGHGFPPFLCSRNKGNKGEKNFKTETIKRLSPMSKCHCFNHSRAFRIQKVLLSLNHGDWQ